MLSLESCDGSAKNIDELSSRLCASNKSKYLFVKLFNG